MDCEEKQGGGRIFLVLWTLALAAFFSVGGYYILSTINDFRDKATARHNARIDPKAVEPGRTAAEDTLPAGANPRKVQVGIYLDGIASISILDSKWSPSFFVWFRWNGDDINPGETFKVVDGTITSKEKLDEKNDKGAHYALYKVEAELTKYFSTDRFPVDDHLLTIHIEDGKMSWSDLEYVADTENTGLSSRVKMPGYKVFKSGLVVKPHSYKSTFGVPGANAGSKITYSQLIYGVWNERAGYGPYIKCFLGLFAAVLIAMLAFFIKPTDVDPRFGLGVGGFFGAVANTFIVAALVPDSGFATLLDMVNGLGMLTIFLTLVQSTISLYLYDIKGNTALSQRFDRISVVVIAIGYVAINLAIPFTGIMR